MATVRNRLVKAKKKKNSSRVRSKNRLSSKDRRNGSTHTVLAGFNLQRFSNDVLMHRNAEGLTQRELGAKTGVTSACIVHIENQKSSPLVTNFARVCQYFKLAPGDYISIEKGSK